MGRIIVHPFRWIPLASIGALVLVGGGLFATAAQAAKSTARQTDNVRQTDATRQTEAAKQTDAANKQASDLQFLNGYDIVIGDTGDEYSGWDNSETRVYARVRSGRREYEHYFDSLPSAYYVLNEMYGDPLIVDLQVLEYGGSRDNGFGRNGAGLIDALNATYIWDNTHQSRGGLPLVLAFNSYWDARNELSYRDGYLMDFRELNNTLNDWNNRSRRDDRVYWRGHDSERWGRDYDNDRWERAWSNRWEGWSFDLGNGWLRVTLNDGGRSERDDRGNRERGNGRSHRRGNGRGSDRGDGDRSGRNDENNQDGQRHNRH